MFDKVKETGSSSAFVGRIDDRGHFHQLQHVYIDRTYYASEWCSNHGMYRVEVLPNLSGTCQYEYWHSPDNRLACLIPVDEKEVIE